MKEPLLYKILHPLIRFVVWFFLRPQVKGLENLKEESYILAGNHTNNLDCLLLIATNKKVIHFLGKDSLFKGLKKGLFKNMGVIPVDRTKKSPLSITKAKEVLNNNGVVCIFPEGTINRTNNIIMPFKYGAVKIAKDSNKKIVLFAIKGKYKLFKKSISITYSKPYVLKKDLTEENNAIMEIVTKMLGEKENEYI